MTHRTYLDENMDDAVVVPFCGGEVGIISQRSPDKDTANEDAAAIFSVSEVTGLLVVADGMGGSRGGESAARITLEELALEVDSTTSESVRESALRAVESANQRILDLGVGAGCTLAMAEIDGSSFRPYHIGDAGLLLVGGRGKIKKLTLSHAPVAYAVESGMLDEIEAMHHDDRHIVTNCLGHADMRIEMGSPITMNARDTLVLASDGLFDNLHIDEISAVVRRGPLDDAIRELMQRCRERQAGAVPDTPSKPDDTTVVVYRPSRAASRTATTIV
ncbi:MAG: serine/threonine-protein phosphatase [Planctomycetes bacterium]|nr:serine/threonine-protein phosphatase [Planctomycetota bacterium]